MKKLIILLIVGAAISPLFAQPISEANASNMYYVNVPVEKVYPSGKGYIIQYTRGNNTIGTIGIPNAWFTEAASRAELIALPRGRNWPTMSVFYREGEFSHIRLYVHRSKAHQTWGSVPQSADVSKWFEDPDNFKIDL